MVKIAGLASKKSESVCRFFPKRVIKDFLPSHELIISSLHILWSGGGDFGVARDNKYPDDSFVTKGRKVRKGDR